MRKGHLILRFTALAIVIAFGFGLIRLWMLRFDAGDIYSPYSSLRSDPLGTRVFYESLEQLPGARLRRNYKPLKKLTRADGDTLFYLGVDRVTMPEEFDGSTSRPDDNRTSAEKAIQDFASSGGRVVITFTPSAGITNITALQKLLDELNVKDKDKGEPETKPADEPETRPADSGEDQDDPELDIDDLDDDDDAPPYEPPEAFWDLSVGVEDDEPGQDRHSVPAVGSHEISSTWPEVAWHGSIFFEKFSESWKVIYRRNDKPVIIERSIGAGSIVICADTYFLSNEAMVTETTRNTQLLAWLAGKPRIVFDETHLGLENRQGVASLAREHGLTSLFFVLLAIAGLYIWKSNVTFLPRDPEQVERFGGRDIAGKSSAIGLHNLLRKCVPVSGVLNECLKHWTASTSTARPKQRDDLKTIKSVIAAENNLPAKRRDPVKTYTKICRILAERKK
jgi:hypothetical protein